MKLIEVVWMLVTLVVCGIMFTAIKSNYEQKSLKGAQECKALYALAKTNTDTLIVHNHNNSYNGANCFYLMREKK